MISYSDDEKRKIIMKHYLNPENRIENTDKIFDKKSYCHSDSCADDLSLFQKNEKLWFQGNGCAIYISSADIFISNYHKNNISLDKMVLIYQKMLMNEENISDKEKEILGELLIFKNVKKQMNRLECALLITKGIEKLKI
ncbi:MAG: iron-sulfur cluster assembly scaffold protein [Metamycoplasmataceae bacterium]